MINKPTPAGAAAPNKAACVRPKPFGSTSVGEAGPRPAVTPPGLVRDSFTRTGAGQVPSRP